MTVLEKLMRAQFESWRARMDLDGEHQDRLHSFEELNESERAYGMAAARSLVESLKDLKPASFELLVERGFASAGYDECEGFWKAMLQAILDESK